MRVMREKKSTRGSPRKRQKVVDFEGEKKEAMREKMMRMKIQGESQSACPMKETKSPMKSKLCAASSGMERDAWNMKEAQSFCAFQMSTGDEMMKAMMSAIQGYFFVSQ